MTTEIRILWFVIISTLLGLVIFVLFRRKDRQAAYRMLPIATLLPGVGPILCLIMIMPFRKNHYALGAEESIRKMKIEPGEYVDRERLMSTVPAHDALTLSSESERRRYLLGLLRQREMSSLRGILHQAVYNRDSEASHYAASGIMELQRVSYQNMEDAKKAYTAGETGSYQAARDYAAAIFDYLKDSEIGKLENEIFRRRYEAVMRDILEHHREAAAQDYRDLIGFLLGEDRVQEAFPIAQATLEAFPEEENYLLLLEIAYRLQNPERFYETLEQLKSSGVELSAKGLNLVRFWSQGAGGA